MSSRAQLEELFRKHKFEDFKWINPRATCLQSFMSIVFSGKVRVDLAGKSVYLPNVFNNIAGESGEENR
jgi:hypothetical protein